MRQRSLGVLFGIVALALVGCGSDGTDPSSVDQTDYRAALRGELQALSETSDDALLQRHFRSIQQVIDAGDLGLPMHTEGIKQIWEAFDDASDPNNPRLRETYLSRARPLIVSWVSPTDEQVSFAWLTLPANWDPKREYPLYLGLHGLWDVAGDRITYLAYPFQNVGSSFAYEDGYLVSPWGRGNMWYRGIAETDIWECIATIKKLFGVNSRRQYITGHSMGGYGAWHIALGSADVWAGLGVHAGALSYNSRGELNTAAAAVLREVPTYFVVGTSDSLYADDQLAYQLLREAGNPHLAFATFDGGHDYRQQDVEGMYLWLRQFRLGPRAAPTVQ